MAERHIASHGENIARLSQLPEFEVADESPDIRGWSVESSDGRTIGEVEDLLVDTNLMQARYLVVDLAEQKSGASEEGRSILVPVDTARLDASERRVRASIQATDATALPRYSGAAVEPGYGERFPRTTAGTGAGRTDTEDSARLTRSAEELRVGRRKVPAGEVQVHKSVEHEHVREPVTTTREDVKVERRPVRGDAAGEAEIGDDEIRVPVTEEEVVVDKRPVVKEEVVVKKDTVTEQEDVEADVRKERIDVDRTGRSAAADRRRKR